MYARAASENWLEVSYVLTSNETTGAGAALYVVSTTSNKLFSLAPFYKKYDLIYFCEEMD